MIGAFAWPAALPLLLLGPALALLLWLLERRRARRLADLAGPRAARLAAELDPRRRRWRRTLAGGGLTAAVLAAMQPLGREQAPALVPRGADLVVCLDVSRSMLARDVPPTRLERARGELRALAAHAGGDRFALVLFAGEARLAVPLTDDAASFAELVDQAEPYRVARGGTDLGAALAAAITALPPADGPQIVLLLTDGEDLGGRGARAAEACRDRGLVVHCVGFGSPRGSKIALPAESGDEYLRAPSGEEVVSAMDADGLRRIAATTGGSFVDAAAGPLPLLELYDERILPQARAAVARGGGTERANLFQWPLLAGFVLWMLELLLDRRR